MSSTNFIKTLLKYKKHFIWLKPVMSLATYYRNALFDHSVNATLKFVYDISPGPLTNLGSRSAHFLLQCDCLSFARGPSIHFEVVITPIIIFCLWAIKHLLSTTGQSGVKWTHPILNNYFWSGYAPIGIGTEWDQCCKLFVAKLAIVNFCRYCALVVAEWSACSPRMRSHLMAFVRATNFSCCCLNWASFFFIFVFSAQLIVHIKFADDWIRTADLWCWKQRL